MADDPVHAICERIAEAQAILEDHVEGGTGSAAEIVVRLHALFAEPELLEAMWRVGYFPPNTPPAGATNEPSRPSSSTVSTLPVSQLRICTLAALLHCLR